MGSDQQANHVIVARYCTAIRSIPHLAEFFLFAFSVLVFQGARFLLSVASAATLEAAEFTTWVLVLTALAYAPVAMLGVPNGMNRSVPILLGSGRTQEADRIEAVTWFCAVVVIAVGVTLGLVLAPASAGLSAGLAVVAGCTISYQVQQFALRSRLAFDRASLHQLVLGIGLLLLAGVTWLGLVRDLPSLIGGYAVVLIFGIAVGLRLHYPPAIAAGAADLKSLVRLGLPIMLVGLVFTVLLTADRWIATLVLGAAAAAPYVLASLLASAVLLVSTIVGQQTYPRLAYALGEGAQAHELVVLAQRQGRTAAVLTAPAFVAVVAFVLLLVPAFLPEFAAATTPAVLLTAGLLVLAWFSGYGNLLNVIGAQWAYLRLQLIALVVAVPLMLFGASSLGLGGLAAAVLCLLVGYGFSIRHLALSRSRAERRGRG